MRKSSEENDMQIEESKQDLGLNTSLACSQTERLLSVMASLALSAS